MKAGKDTSALLVESGIVLFGARGYDGVTTRELAHGARTNISSIKYHFGGKEELYRAVLACAERISVHVFPPAVIDRDGLHKSNLRGLRAALWACQPADVCLVDGFRLGPSAPPHRAVVDGDEKSAAIAAASIVAKVTRDRYMKTADAIYPAYGFCTHVGYITPSHSRIVRERGPSEIHRRSFQALCYRSDADVELAAAEA